VAASLTAIELVAASTELRDRLFRNAELFRRRMSEEGFELLDGEHAIVPVMFGDAALAARIADAMLDHGVYVTAFSFPVVPREQAQIRVQLSAAHTEADIDEAVRAFVRARTEGLGWRSAPVQGDGMLPPGLSRLWEPADAVPCPGRARRPRRPQRGAGLGCEPAALQLGGGAARAPPR